VLLLKATESFSFFGLSSNLTARRQRSAGRAADLVCSLPAQTLLDKEWHFASPGVVYGVLGLLSTTYGFLLGPLVDKSGVRKALVVATLLSAASRYALAFTSSASKSVVLFLLFLPLASANALCIPVLTIGIRRCTHRLNRGVAFGLFYTSMNLAAVIAESLNDSLSPRGTVLAGAVSSTFSVCIAALLREGVRVADSAEPSLPSDLSPASAWEEEADAPLKQKQPPPPPPPPSYAELLRSRRLRQYLCVCLLLINLRTVSRHLEATLKPFLLRAFGCSTKAGAIQAINPAMVILLVPLVAAATTRERHFDMIRHGAWLSSLAPLWLVVTQSLAGAGLFVATTTLGESFWSPRWYDYSMQAAPEGREGMFSALAGAPLFFAAFPTGLESDALLKRFCPSDKGLTPDRRDCAEPNADYTLAQVEGFCRGRPVWGLITLFVTLSPLAMFVFRDYLGATGEADLKEAGGPRGGVVGKPAIELHGGYTPPAFVEGRRGEEGLDEEGVSLDAPLLENVPLHR